jgi:hypothetical protein
VHRLVAFALVFGVYLSAVSAAEPRQAAPDPITGFLARLERALAGDSQIPLAALVAPDADRQSLDDFASRWVSPATTRATVRERDRSSAEGTTHVTAEALLETGNAARLATWQLELSGGGDTPLALRKVTGLGALEGLFHLVLDTTRQFEAHDLHVKAEDFDLALPRGVVFIAEVPGGTTALVLMGKGSMTFSPAPETERGQVRIFSGSDTLRTSFDTAFVRVGPADLGNRIDTSKLRLVAVDPKLARQADEIFRDAVARSFTVDLNDFSPETWSLLPTTGDFLAEVRTGRFGTLTYANASNEPEDITLFDRERRRNISVYASKQRLAVQGPFYDEDDRADFDVLDYNVDASFAPDRLWLDARARLKIQVRSFALSSLTLRLARTLFVRSVTADRFGRLLHLRVRNQDTLVVNFPAPLPRDAEVSLTISYVGRLEPQALESEAIGGGQIVAPQVSDAPLMEPEDSYLYSNRSYWYPQRPATDYGTAQIRFNVPRSFGVVCSGDPASGSPVTVRDPSGDARQMFVFATAQPVRYLACLVTRFMAVETRQVPIRDRTLPSGVEAGRFPRYDTLTVFAQANPRQRTRARGLLDRAVEISTFYAGLMHDAPYPSFTLAVIDSHLPGGHSPPYFAALQSPVPGSPYVWRNDPANFQNYPEFFLAHELAHQWWGQAIGWKNYHEQWLSEGFAQYFAALYAEHARGPGVMDDVIDSMSKWAVDTSDQGPVYLGYRLGHIRNEGRVLRAIVYNKGAMALHMLRRLIGDEAFFGALRRFYTEFRFKKAGTDDFRQAIERETGKSFSRFFERWIYGADLPSLEWSVRVDGEGDARAALLHFEQGPKVFDLPVTVSVELGDGTTKTAVVALTERSVDARVPLGGTARVRDVRINRDRAALIAREREVKPAS